MIFGILAEIAMASRLGDGTNDRWPLLAAQVAQLCLKANKAWPGHRKFLHAVSSQSSVRSDCC
jgi:hypothetical protein